MTTDTAVEAPEKRARWEDFVDVFLSPAELYTRRQGEGWFKPYLLLCAVFLVLYYTFLPINGMVVEATMLKSAAQANPEQLQRGIQVMKYAGGVMLSVGFILIIATTALGLKLASSVIEPAAKWGQAFLIATYAGYVWLAQQVFGVIAVYWASRAGPVSTSDASFGPLRFVENPDPVLKAVLTRFELFSIWSAILCAIGLIVMVGMPRGKAIATAAITWLFVGLPGVVGALLSSGTAR